MSDFAIPTVDLHDLASSDLERQEKASDAILTAFGTYGLIYIRNHGIETERLEAFYSAFLEFTDRPEDEKEAVARPDIWFQRGWTPPNTERAVAAGGQPDFKECYFAAPEPLDEEVARQYPEIYAENIWPEAEGAFEKHYMFIGHQLHRVGLELLRGAAAALGLKPWAFEAGALGAPHVTRSLRYLPVTQAQIDAGVLWGEEHTDYNLLTLLPGGRFLDAAGNRTARPDDACGLYLRTRPTEEHPNGQMLPGKPPEGCIVAQVGQQLEILTGGTFLATPHVIKAPGTTGYARVSMAHFIHMHAHQTLFPMKPFRTAEALAAYSPPVLAGTYGTKTLVDIGLAPKEALNAFGYRHYDRLDTMRANEAS